MHCLLYIKRFTRNRYGNFIIINKIVRNTQLDWTLYCYTYSNKHNKNMIMWFYKYTCLVRQCIMLMKIEFLSVLNLENPISKLHWRDNLTFIWPAYFYFHLYLCIGAYISSKKSNVYIMHIHDEMQQSINTLQCIKQLVLSCDFPFFSHVRVNLYKFFLVLICCFSR